jgi:hypothetical protein
MMRLQYLAGDRAGAIRQFQRCVAALHEELGIKPSRRTCEVYERIRADQLDLVPSRPAAPEAAASEGRVSPALMPDLRELKSQLLMLQDHVQFQIQRIDEALGSPALNPSLD